MCESTSICVPSRPILSINDFLSGKCFKTEVVLLIRILSNLIKIDITTEMQIIIVCTILCTNMSLIMATLSPPVLYFSSFQPRPVRYKIIQKKSTQNASRSGLSLTPAAIMSVSGRGRVHISVNSIQSDLFILVACCDSEIILLRHHQRSGAKQQKQWRRYKQMQKKQQKNDN